MVEKLPYLFFFRNPCLPCGSRVGNRRNRKPMDSFVNVEIRWSRVGEAFGFREGVSIVSVRR